MSDIVRRPIGVFRDQPGTIDILHGYNTFSRAIMYVLRSTFAIILLKKQIVKIRKSKADSDSDGGENNIRSRLQKIQKHLFVAFYLPSAAQAKYIYFCIYIFYYQK